MRRRLKDAEKSQRAGRNEAARCVWTELENARLEELARAYGAKNWDAIAAELTTVSGTHKSARQCRERWHNHLNPAINDLPWSLYEELQVFSLHQQFGNKWSLIASKMSGRTDNTIKNFFFCKLRKTARFLKYGIASLELDKEENRFEHVVYVIDYLYKYYISPNCKENFKKILTPQIKERKNGRDKYVVELIEKEGITAERFDKFMKDLMATLTPAQLDYACKNYPHLFSSSPSDTDDTFSNSHKLPSLSQAGSVVRKTSSISASQASKQYPESASVCELGLTLPVPASFSAKPSISSEFVPVFDFSPYSVLPQVPAGTGSLSFQQRPLTWSDI